MKKLFACFLALSLLCASSALAAEDLTGYAIADGNVAAVAFRDVTAPYSGTLASFDLSMGDTVEAGQTLMSYVTTTLYASENGVVRAVNIAKGDDAAAVTARYGGVVGIEPAHRLTIAATTVGAANHKANKIITLGETLYFRSTLTGREEGFGRVAAVSGTGYQVEITGGEFQVGETLSLYRKDTYATDDCVGKGAVSRRDDVLAQASGRVAAVLVQEGDTVMKGQALCELVSADAAPTRCDADVTAEAAGVLAAVSVQAGQQVWKGQVLCRIYLTDSLEVVADVDEMDLADLRVGDAVPVTLDTDKTKTLNGTVTEISALGVSKLNAAYYTVHVAIPAGSAQLGASASIYLKMGE